MTGAEFVLPHHPGRCVYLRGDGAAKAAPFTGWYAEIGYVLTGKQRTYRPERASFGSPVPRLAVSDPPSIGSWEVLAHISHANPNSNVGIDGSVAPQARIRSGAHNISRFGVHWTPVANLKLMLEYQIVGTHRVNPANSQNPEPIWLRSIHTADGGTN